MQTTTRLALGATIGLLLAALLLAPVLAIAAPYDYATRFRGFGVDVTGTAQGFLISDKVGGSPPISACGAWIVENDDALGGDTIWIAWSEGGASTPTPVAVVDATDSVPNQMRLKPQQWKVISGYTNPYMSVICGNADSAANLHVEATCVK